MRRSKQRKNLSTPRHWWGSSNELVKPVLSFLVGALSLWLGMFAIRPDISIDAYATTDPRNPLAARFYIQNISPYTIGKVTPWCAIDFAKGPQIDIEGGQVEIGTPADSSTTLEPQAKTTATCELQTNELDRAMVTVLAVYRVPLWIERCKAMKFQGLKIPDGTFIWEYRGSDPKRCDHVEAELAGMHRQ